MRFIFGIIALLLLAVADAGAVTRYVDNTCTNGLTTYDPVNRTCITGSSLVYSTIANGVAAINAGDTLLIRGGTYLQRLPFPRGGTGIGSETIISRYPGETVIFQPGANTMTGTATPANNSYVIFDGLIFDGTGSSGFSDGFSICCYATGPAYITFRNGEIKNFDGNGVSLHADNIQILNSSIHNNGANLTAGPGHGIYSSCHVGCVIDGNHVFNNDHYGIHVYDGDNPTLASNHIVRNNVVNGNGKSTVGLTPGGFGIILNHGTNNAAYNNVLYDNGAAGLTSGGIQIGSACTNCKVYNNTLYANANYGIDIYPGASGTIVRNNITWNNAIGSLIDEGSSGLLQDHNLCNSGCTGTASLNGVDPLFVNASTRDFRLQAGSQAIDRGTANIAPFITIPVCSGSTTLNCYNGTAPDLGAMETGVPTAGGGPPTLTVNLTSVPPGGTIQVTVDDDDVNQRIELTGDSVNLLPSGAANYDQSPLDYLFMNGTKTAPSVPISNAVLTFTAPSTVGAYDFVFYPEGATQANQYLATATFNVVAPGIVMKFNISTVKIGPSVTWKIGTP